MNLLQLKSSGVLSFFWILMNILWEHKKNFLTKKFFLNLKTKIFLNIKCIFLYRHCNKYEFAYVLSLRIHFYLKSLFLELNSFHIRKRNFENFLLRKSNETFFWKMFMIFIYSINNIVLCITSFKDSFPLYINFCSSHKTKRFSLWKKIV
jgi:hypothetical protein